MSSPTQLPQDALAALDAKSKAQSSATPAQPQQAPQQAAPPQASAGAQDDDSADKDTDEEVAGKVNLLKQYSKLNAAIADLLDNLAVRRSISMPHQVGQPMDQHIKDFGAALLKNHGGATKNLIFATHTHHDPKGGVTIAYPTDKLKQTIIPAKFEPAIHAAAACRTLVNKIAGLVPDEPAVKQAQSQIKIISQNNLSGMTAYDAAASLVAIVHPLFQLLSRRHQFVKHGEHTPTLTGPRS